MAEWQVGRHTYTIPDDATPELQQQMLQAAAAKEAGNQAINESDFGVDGEPKEGDAGWMDTVARGVDTFQATTGRAVEAFGELVNSEDLERTGREYAEEQWRQADLTAPAPDNFLGMIQESLPEVGAVASAAAGGAAIGSVIPGVGTLGGGLIGGTLAAFGLNVGDVKEVQTHLNEITGKDSEFGAKELGISGLATIPDLVFGRIATGPLKAAAAHEVKQVIADGFKSKVQKNARRAGTEIALDVVKDTAAGAAAGGVSAGIVVGGTTLSEGGTDLVRDQADAIGQSIGDGLLLGGTLGGALSGLSSTPELINAARDKNVPGVREGEDGTVEFTEVNPLYAQNVHDRLKPVSDFISSVAGKATDPLMRRYGDNPYAKNIIAGIVQRPELRTEMSRKAGTRDEFGDPVDTSTMSNFVERWTADSLKASNYYKLRKMPKADLDFIKAEKAKGNLDNPDVAGVQAFFQKAIEDARAAGKDVGDLGPTYLPFFMDRKKLTGKLGRRDPARMQEFVDGAINDLVVRGRLDEADVSAVKTARARFERYVDDIIAGGTTRLGDELRLSEDFLTNVQEAQLGDATALRKLSDPLISKTDVKLRRSNLDTHRELSELSQEFLENWSKDMSLVDMMDNYANLSAISIAAAQKFGPNGEKFARNLRLANAEQIRTTGKGIPAEDIQRFVDVANVSQLLPTGNRTPEERAAWRALRGVSTMINLQGATVSSIFEPFFLIPKLGGRATATGLTKALMTVIESQVRKTSKTLQKLPLNERMQFVEELNLSSRQAISSAATKIGEDAMGITTGEHAVIKWSGLAHWTAFTKLWAGYAAEHRIKRLGQSLADDMVPGNKMMAPKKRARVERQLEEAGLDPQRVRMWVQEGARQDHYYYQNFIRDGIRNVTRDVLILPEAVDLPLWASDPRMTIFSNLKSFALAFNNTIGREWIRSLIKAGQNPRQAFITASTLSIALPLFVLLDGIKAASKGQLEDWQDKDARTRMMSGLSRLGGAGLVIDPFLAESYQKSPGTSLISPVMGVAETPVLAMEGIWKTLTGQQEPEDLLSDVVNTMTRTTPFVGKPIQEAFEP